MSEKPTYFEERLANPQKEGEAETYVLYKGARRPVSPDLFSNNFKPTPSGNGPDQTGPQTLGL